MAALPCVGRYFILVTHDFVSFDIYGPCLTSNNESTYYVQVILKQLVIISNKWIVKNMCEGREATA
jgi:hypothetical protein